MLAELVRGERAGHKARNVLSTCDVNDGLRGGTQLNITERALLTVYTFSLVLDVLNTAGVTFAIEDIASQYSVSENEPGRALLAYSMH